MALTKKQKVARNAFVRKYGKEARNVVDYVVRGWTSGRIADKFMVPAMTVAAYRANVTRGTYSPFVTESGNGTCGY